MIKKTVVTDHVLEAKVVVDEEEVPPPGLFTYVRVLRYDQVPLGSGTGKRHDVRTEEYEGTEGWHYPVVIETNRCNRTKRYRVSVICHYLNSRLMYSFRTSILPDLLSLPTYE